MEDVVSSSPRVFVPRSLRSIAYLVFDSHGLMDSLTMAARGVTCGRATAESSVPLRDPLSCAVCCRPAGATCMHVAASSRLPFAAASGAARPLLQTSHVAAGVHESDFETIGVYVCPGDLEAAGSPAEVDPAAGIRRVQYSQHGWVAEYNCDTDGECPFEAAALSESGLVAYSGLFSHAHYPAASSLWVRVARQCTSYSPRRARRLHALYSRVTDHRGGLSLPCAAWRQAHTRMAAVHVDNIAPSPLCRACGLADAVPHQARRWQPTTDPRAGVCMYVHMIWFTAGESWHACANLVTVAACGVRVLVTTA